MRLILRLARRIAQSGPIPMSEFMDACLHDPQFGYYATNPAIGLDGDFITAPVISQMFGELIGAWVVEMWAQMGRPPAFLLIEMGPGDGTLMSDVLRTAKLDPDFLQAAELWLIETSPPLRARQAERLAMVSPPPQWADRLDQAPRGRPVILLANEFLDCLPVRQFIKQDKAWAERVVGLDGPALAYGLVPAPDVLIPSPLKDCPLGSVVEVSRQQESLGSEVGERVNQDGGVALFIDYGRAKPATGDTLQALKRHQTAHPLETAGSADLTVHADFPAFTQAAIRAGAEASETVTQANFLKDLGLEVRAEALARFHPDRRVRLAREVDRLTGLDQMGALFKVVALYSKGLLPPGF